MTTTAQLARSIGEPILDWYERHGRDLPWRRPDTSPWGVLVSEVMLQQTPVARVLPVYAVWIARWPAPADLAAAGPAAAIRAWGKLGYPRRALRLHEAASAMLARHGGEVPPDYHDLRELPGVGDYTAAAVASFAYGRRHAVLDTNVRRVLARVSGAGTTRAGGPSVAERRLAASLVPPEPATAARWAVAVMELGALVCKARAPECSRCPIATACEWRRAGRPPSPPGRRQRYEGTDRQARGRLLDVMRDTMEPVSVRTLRAAWPDDRQRARALDGLVADGLVEPLPADCYRLPADGI